MLTIQSIHRVFDTNIFKVERLQAGDLAKQVLDGITGKGPLDRVLGGSEKFP